MQSSKGPDSRTKHRLNRGEQKEEKDEQICDTAFYKTEL